MSSRKPGTTARIDKRLLISRIFLILLAVPPVYWLVYRVTSTLFSLYDIAWMPHTISLLISIQLTWTIWTRLGWWMNKQGE